MLLHGRIKQMPGQVRHRTVIASVFLGWRQGGAAVPGYRCFLVAQDMSVPDDPMLCAYVMRAAAIDADWVQDEEWFNISTAEAEGMFRAHFDMVTKGK